MDELYNRIETLCKEAGENITTMCKLAGVPRSALSDYKAGRIKSLSADKLSKIASHFNVSVDYLLGNVNDPYFHLDNQRIADEINSLDGYKKPAAPQGNELSGVYLSFAKTAQDEGLDPADIEYALNLVRRIREQEKKRNRGE